MKLVLQVQIRPDAKAAVKIRATVERFNEAANWVAGVAFERKCANRIALQKIVYYEIRQRFGLSAQMACLCVRRVCEVYKRDRTIQPTFRPDAAMTYDLQSLSFKAGDKASLQTLNGRVKVPMMMGDYQREQFKLQHCQTDLIHRKDGKWFLLIAVDVPEPAPVAPRSFIGADLGVVNIATTDDGETFSGSPIEACRQKYKQIRKTCQRTGTKSAKRKLRKASKKEARFRRDQNHCISKRLVAKAKGTGSAIGLEDLGGIIGDGKRFRKPQRSRMKGWAFYQLRTFISYKAALAGVPVIPVDPRNTSRTCSECGHCEKANRRSRDEFECRHCGFKLPADWNAARNIRDWAKVMLPNVGVDDIGGRIPIETTGKPVLASPRL